jgi:hypothetical protein
MAAGHEINLYYPEAAGGSFVVELHGTSTLATVFSDYDCLVTTAVRSISAAGRAKFYVKTLVDVEVKDFGGVTVDNLVAEGTRAEHVGVQSTSFTGTLDGGGSGAGGSIYLKSLLDKWFTSADGLDFNVKETGTGSAVPLKTALANLRSNNAQVFNVKSPPYNAVGDGVTNDDAAIQAALVAIQFNNGGVLYFPAGDYLLSQTISLGIAGGVIIEGEAPESATIVSTNGSAAISMLGNYFAMANISVQSASLTSTLVSVQNQNAVNISNCYFLPNSSNTTPSISIVDVARMTVSDSLFSANTAPRFNLGGTFASLIVTGCEISGAVARVTGGSQVSLIVNGNDISTGGATSIVDVVNAAAASFITVTGNNVVPTGVGITYLIDVNGSVAISVSESGNQISTNLGAVINPIRFAGASTGSVQSTSKKPVVTATTGASAAPRLGAGMTTVIANANFTVNAPVLLDGTSTFFAWNGAEVAIQIHNSTGGNITTALNAAYHGVATGNLAAGASRIFRFRYNNAGTVSGWIQQGPYIDVT